MPKINTKCFTQFSGASEKIVYVSYGSNLYSARFNVYITGGKIEGNTRTYLGCQDKTLPEWKKAYVLNGSIIMAGTSSLWGGGVAFYNPDGEGQTLASGYLISVEQFNDIVSQENGGEAGGITINFEELLQNGEANIGGKYGKIIYLWSENSIPLVTFTYGDSFHKLTFNPASNSYLDVIRRGLKETFKMGKKEIETYLNYANSAPYLRDIYTYK